MMIATDVTVACPGLRMGQRENSASAQRHSVASQRETKSTGLGSSSAVHHHHAAQVVAAAAPRVMRTMAILVLNTWEARPRNRH